MSRSTLPPIPAEQIAALKSLESISVSCEFRPNGVYELEFTYMTWTSFRKQCIRQLARHAGLRRIGRAFRTAEHLQLVKNATAFAGSKKAYEARSRKISYARMIAALREILPNLNDETVKLLAGTALSHCLRGACRVWGGVHFKASWDMETLRAFLAFRRHELPVSQFETAADIQQYVLRYLDSLPFTCRRKVKSYVLQHRHYCRDYDVPETLKAIDCSFKYTGRAYAFRKARYILLARTVPELFFKKAGQKIRLRQYAAWLNDHRHEFHDIVDSLRDIPEPESRFDSWADLERHSREWHAQQIADARVNLQDVGYEPFNLPPGVPRKYTLRGYAFSLLASPEQMADEGVQMRHCINSYASDVRRGSYLAYKVEGNTERATFGLWKSEKGWTFDQVRLKRNVMPSLQLSEACFEFKTWVNAEIRNSEKKSEVA